MFKRNIYLKRGVIAFLGFLLVTACKRENIPGENEIKDPRDGTIYKTVQLGDKVWMAENLAFLPFVDSSHIESDSAGHYYVYGYQEPKLSIARQTTNYFTYGVLYNYTAAIKACPEGWHLPSDHEWKDLESFFGMDPEEFYITGYRKSGDVGDKIKSPYGWEGSGYGIDEPGFNARGGGRRIAFSGTFLDMGTHAFFWASTITANNNAMVRYLVRDSSGIFRSEGSVKNAFSVRCVRD